MYIKLHQLLQRPAPYEKTQKKFWNDPHISKRMLEVCGGGLCRRLADAVRDRKKGVESEENKKWR